ncbi:MAG: ribonuclease P protein component [Patescibacteria group bacterium]
MLASKNRLKKKIDFARIEIDGVMYQSRSFGMGIYNRKDEESSHFGFIISTKISKKAVIRNKIKRIISEAIRKRLGSIKKGLDVIYLIKPFAVKIDKIELEREVDEIITKNLQINSLPNS